MHSPTLSHDVATYSTVVAINPSSPLVEVVKVEIEGRVDETVGAAVVREGAAVVREGAGAARVVVF